MVLVLAVIAVPASAALAQPRMPVGFYDDNSFRWDPNVAKNFEAARAAHTSIIHVTAQWSQIAPTRPASPLDGNDPAYHLSDLDALVRNAGQYGLQVMINISGAPKWANGGLTPNHPPKSASTMRQFAEMLAKRYNGTTTRGLVSRWSVWNEPNLQLFLTPQFSKAGKIVSAAAYLKVYKAAYAGIKAGNPKALVAIGETSNRGRDRPLTKAQTDSVSPGNFARLLAQLDPKLKFDAWATHPYPTDPFLGPTQKVKWPNVTLTRITQFGESLQKWFHRRVPIWITEYGEQTKPQFAMGVTYKQQAKDAQTALKMAAASPYVEMFVWFTIKDAPSTWQSGFFTSKGHKKPGYAAFSAVAKTVDGQTQIVKPGKDPTVKLEVPFMAFHDPPGAMLGITYRIDGAGKGARSKLLFVAQTRTKLLARNGTVSFKVSFKPAKGKQYLMTADVADRNGQHQKRTVALVTAR